MIYAALLLCFNLGSEEAAFKAALARAESAQQLNHVDLAVLELAQFYLDHGRYQDAELLYLRSSEINQTLYGPSSRPTALSLLRLGAIYHAELRLSQAELPTRRAAGILEVLSGQDSLDFAYAMANLAAILADQGQYARAEPVLRRALWVFEKQGAPGVAALQANLGIVYLRQGEPRKAEPVLKSAFEKFDAAGDPARANALGALAELAIADGRWLDADRQIRQAEQLTLDIKGEHHPWLAGVLHLKGVVESHFGDSRSAIVDFQHAIELIEALAGPESPGLLAILDDYAFVLKQCGRNGDAKSNRRRAKLIRQALSQSHSRTLVPKPGASVRFPIFVVAKLLTALDIVHFRRGACS